MTTGGTGGTDWGFFGGTGADGNFKANPEFLRMLASMGSNIAQGKSGGEAIGDATMEALKMRALQGNNPQTIKPTPKGQAGPDSITTKETADGITQTIQTPSKTNLNTYGTSVPPESMSTASMGGVSEQPPFWEAFLGQSNNPQM